MKLRIQMLRSLSELQQIKIGDTEDDTIIHLKDKKNSGKLTILRAKLKELAL